MPTYEYACSTCGTHIEVYQRFSDEPLTECGVCGGTLRKVFHPAGILFKGTGFYKTDSRSGRTGAAAKSTGAESDSKASEKSAPTEKATTSKDAGSTSSSSSSKEKTA